MMFVVNILVVPIQKSSAELGLGRKSCSRRISENVPILSSRYHKAHKNAEKLLYTHSYAA